MKKLLGAGMIAAAALFSVACSGGSGAGTTTAAQAPESAAETTAQAGGAGTEAAMAEGTETFIIGSLGPLTGGAASYGNSVKQGAEIAIEEINGAGGVKVGDKVYMLSLNFLDDEATEEKAVTAYNTLIDSGVHAIMGAVTSGSSLAITDLSQQDGLLQITPSGSAAAITENDNVFRLCFTDPLQGVTIADYILEKGYTSVAVLYNNADEYSTGIYEAFKEVLIAKGAGDLLVAEESFVTEDNEFATQLTKIKSTGAEAIFVPAYYEAAAYITQQAKAAGIEADFIGSDGWDGVLAQVTDPSAVEGAIFLSPFLASDPSAKVFVDTYNEKYKAIPDQFAADGYDTVYVIKAAMEQAGSVESADLIAAMTEITVEGLTGNVSFDASGEPEKEAKFVIIQNGEYAAK